MDYTATLYETLKSLKTPCPELLKLLGTMYLCISTLIGAVKSQALPLLSVLIQEMISILEYTMDIRNPSEDIWRSRTLLIRSVVSTIASIISDLPSFCHPFVLQILKICLQVYSTVKHDVDIVWGEIDRCLGLIISEIPFRTLLPCLEEGVGDLLALSHTAARKVCELLGEIWG